MVHPRTMRIPSAPPNSSRARLRDEGVVGGSVVLYARSRGGSGVVVYCVTPAVQGSFSVHSLRQAEPAEPIRNRAQMTHQVGLRMSKRRTINVILRFCSYELEELDNLVNAYGGLPRSSLVNIALNEFLHSPKEQDLDVQETSSQPSHRA